MKPSLTNFSSNMKKALLFLLILLYSHFSFGQALSAYGFTAFSGSYTAPSSGFINSSGGTSWGSSIYDDCYYNSIPIGFNFVYCGNTYTSLSASQNCWIVLGQTFGTTVYNTYDCDLSNTTAGGFGSFNLARPIIAAFWLDVIVSTNNVRYATTGTAPNRVFTIEFYHCGLYPSTTPAEDVEIILYETTNIIDFAYTNISSGSTSTGHFAIGITDGVGGFPTTGTLNYWSLNGTGSSPAASMTTESRFLTGLPATNQIYRWSPQCSGTPTAGTVSASVTSACTSYSSLLTLTGASTSLGITYQWQSSPNNVTWTNIAGATNLTYTAFVTTSMYYRCVVTCTNSGISSSTASVFLVLNTPPGTITGVTTLCAGTSSTFTNPTSGGTWTSSNVAAATVGSSSGVVTGVSPGTTTISYTMPTGCAATISVTVVAGPSAISGPASVCTGTTVTLTDLIPGGTWSSSATGIATIGATTGIVSGLTPGVTTITYSIGSCTATRVETVNISPAPITGPTSVCVGSSIVLTDATAGGSWSSSNVFIASVGSTTGVVTGVGAGTVTISYTLPGGCYSTWLVSVNPLPTSITGLTTVCVAQTSSLFCSGGGTWTSSNTSIATVGSTTGIVVGVSAGPVVITYTLPTGCYSVFPMTVLPPPAPITGSPLLCMGSFDTLANATPGGYWASSSPLTVAIDPGLGVDTGISPGTAVIYYTIGTGCYSTLTVTVNPPPLPITGTPWACVGATTTLFGGGAGTWSSGSPGIATVGSSTGVVTGVASGVAIITFMIPSGCYTTIPVTINPLPAPIAGSHVLCVGLTTTLTDAVPGGTWSSSNTLIATVGSLTGVVTATGPGVATIYYTLPGGCSGLPGSFSVTVNTSPAPITGSFQVCQGSTTTLYNITGGGTWSSSVPAIAPITGGGVVTGLTAGLSTITYSLGAGCYATQVITVNPLPGTISGPGVVCAGSSITLTCTGGGAWSSSTPSVATIGSTTGIVLGVAAGTTTISYTLGTTCYKTKVITVNPLPAPILGTRQVCQGATTTLTDITPGGTWGSSSLPIATVGSSSGVVTGVAGGTATITYIIGTGCYTIANVTVNPLPPLCSVTGGGNYCAGGVGLHVGLSCSSVGIMYQLYNGTFPVGVPIAGTGGAIDFGLITGAGTYTVVATNSITGCSRAMTGSAVVTINPLPAAIGGPSAVCVGSSITVTDPTPGGTWTSSAPSIATIGATTGVINGLVTGTTNITYTLTSTGCQISKNVTVSATPSAISGGSTACTLSTLTLTDAVPGGVWTSSSTSVALIGSLTGVLTGVISGTTTVTYSLGTGCTVTKNITVNPSPAAIGGTPQVCVGFTTLLTETTTGGAWSSSAPLIGTVSTTGTVGGISPGTTIVKYMLPTGCYSDIVVTVNPLPSAIVGPFTVCVNGTTTLTDTVTGGTWTSASPGIATIGGASGMVTGMAAGTSLITYSLGSGCTTTARVTVNPLPSAITGTAQVCVGLTTTLSDITPGGAWSTSTPATGTISGGGIVTGIAPGVDTIFYTLPATGCAAMKLVTVNPLPLPIGGSVSVCVGQSATLTDATPGGTWSSASPAIASVGATTGIVTGNSSGNTTITYTAGGCWVTNTVTVVSSPSPITGPSSVCMGNNITLSNATSGGVWSSGIPVVAAIGSGTGIVTGMSSGTAIISYTLGTTGCRAVFPVIVNPVAPILGPPSVCVGQTAYYIDTASGGTWSSGNPLIATIVPSSGMVTGVSAAMVIITYTMPTTCYATKLITVIPTPPAITGVTQVCAGGTTTLFNSVPGGAWSSSNTMIATVDPFGVVAGIISGVATITYTSGTTGCFATTSVTVNGLPAPISGPGDICVGTTALYTSSTTGGTWSSSNPAAATILPTSGLAGGVAPGTANIIYTVSTGCNVSKPVTVNGIPPGITGSPNFCVGSTTSLSNPAPGGTWSSAGTYFATVDPITGVVTGIHAGTTTISYTLGAGCSVSIVITVNPLPGPITGSPNVCVGGTTTLSNSTAGGTWTTSDPTVATVDSTTGVVTGVAPGSVTIFYSIGSGCTVSMTVLVNAGPAAISGSPDVCIGQTTFLSDATPGGVWSSGSTSIALVDAFGVVTGLSLGTAVISYSMTGTTGCSATLTVTVHPLPGAITGSPNVCVGGTTTLSNSVPGGTWSSSNTAIATVSGTGVVTGVAAGAVTMTYTLGATCFVTLNMVVDPRPLPVFGPNTVCESQTISLLSVTFGGTWSSSDPTHATIGASTGVVTGVMAGTTLISYTNGFGCAAIYPVTVNQMPSPIIGSANICLGGTSTLRDTAAGGIWTSSNTAVATIGSSSGIVGGVSLGTATITYQLPAGCMVTKVINVYPLPLVFTVTGGGNHCDGDTGVHIYLSGSTVGLNYMLYNGATAVGAFAGTGSPLDFGLHTVAGPYNVVGTSTATGCSVNMSGVAMVNVIRTVLPVVTMNITPNDTICAGATATFTPVAVNGGSAPVYQWSVNGFPVSLSGSYSFIPADGDIVTVAMTSNAVCPAPATVTRSVTMEVQPFGTPTVDVALSPNDTVCRGNAITATGVTAFGGPSPLYLWYKNGTIVPGVNGPTYSFVPNNGDQLFTVMYSNYMCRLSNVDTSASVKETVVDQVLPSVTMTASPGTTIGRGQYDTLSVTVINAVGPTYQWLINGIPVPGATNSVFVSNTFSLTSDDSLSCQVTSNGICTITTHAWVYIHATAEGVAMNGMLGGEVMVLPNPSHGVITIKGAIGGIEQDVTLEITDMLGQVVYRGAVVAKGGQLDEQVTLGNNLANGMYLLSVRSETFSKVFNVVLER